MQLVGQREHGAEAAEHLEVGKAVGGSGIRQESRNLLQRGQQAAGRGGEG